MEAAFQRNIKSGTEYNALIPAPLNQIVELPKGDVFATLESIQDIVSSTLNQTVQLAQKLKGNSLGKTCANIWNFLYNHIQYTPDEPGIEQLRNPSRSWYDRAAGIDCDCYSVFISSILTNLGIAHSLRITEYAYKGFYQHVYVVVPKNGKTTSRQDYYVIDPVLDQFDYEKPFTKKHDKNMKIPQQYLNGLDSNVIVARYGGEFKALKTLGFVSKTESAKFSLLNATKDHLTNTLLVVKTDPASVASIVDPKVFEAQLEYLLENWNDPIARPAVLEELAEMEKLGEGNKAMSGLGCLCPATGYSKPAKISTSDAITKIALLRDRRMQSPRVAPATIQNGALMLHPTTKAIYDKMIPKDLVASLSGYDDFDGLGGFFQTVKDKASDLVDKVQDKVSDIKETVKETAAKVGDALQTAGSAILAHNPISFATRNGVYLAFQTNAFQLGEKFYYSYFTQAQAQEYGLDLGEWAKLVERRQRVENTIITLGGDAANLRDAIVKGKGAEKVEFRALGVVAEVAAAGTIAGVVAKIVSFLKDMDFIKLLAKAKSVVGLAKNLLPGKEANNNAIANQIATLTANLKPVALVSKTGERIPVAVDTSAVIDDDYSTPMQTKSAEDTPKPPAEEKSKMPLIIGGIAVAGIAYMATRPKGTASTPATKTKKVKV